MESNTLERALPNSLKEMVEVIADAFQRQGESAEEAQKMARVSTLSLAAAHGGHIIYLPRGPKFRRFLEGGTSEPGGKAPQWKYAVPGMVQRLASAHEREGRGPECAQRIAHESLLALGEYFGGRGFYLPRGEAVFRALRDKEIMHRIGKERAADLAREFGVCAVQIYDIVRTQRAAARKARG
jgi:Mor family transcriptional regulator